MGLQGVGLGEGQSSAVSDRQLGDLSFGLNLPLHTATTNGRAPVYDQFLGGQISYSILITSS